MFKKILFLVILAGIGFGIYTGIHKIFEVVSTPKTVITTGTTISMVTTGSDISEIPSFSGNITEESTETVEETVQVPGWFSRTWTSIKGWFSSKAETIKEDDRALTGDIVTEPNLSGDIITGNMFEDMVPTGTEVEEVVSNIIIDTGVVITKVSTEATVVAKPVTTKTTNTVRKTSTTTTKTTTSTSGKDPILDALFR